MSYQENTFYKLVNVGKKAVSISENLVKSYPLAKRLLKILKTNLLINLEFGFFTEGSEVLVQGEQGKDLLLICSHRVDVIVNAQKIVELPAPILLGDKGIIEKDSTRAATIAISEGHHALVIKIPVGKFIKNFKDSSISDSEFEIEKKLYFDLFQEVQHRLFKYVFLQKTLWEEVNSALNSLNIHLISNTIDKQKEVIWSPVVWTVIKQYLKTAYKFQWPDNIELNVKNFHLILKSILDKRFSYKNFKGSESGYISQKQLIWRKWLAKVSEICMKVMPKKELPIDLGEVELFNPRNYQLMLQNLLWTIEKKFLQKKENDDVLKKKSGKLKVKNFFGKEVDSNEFNLTQYLETFENIFKLKNPNRILSQIAQQSGVVAAKCENEFNTSVSRMQRFLEKVKSLAIPIEEPVEKLKNWEGVVKAIQMLNKSFQSYEKQLVGNRQQYIGEIRLDINYSPTGRKLLKSCGIEHTKKLVERSFYQIIEALGLNITDFDKSELLNFFYLFKATDKDAIRYREFKTHYWIPVLHGTFLKRGEEVFAKVPSGSVIGGPGWEHLEVHTDSFIEEGPSGNGKNDSEEVLKENDTLNPDIATVDIQLDDSTGWYIQVDQSQVEDESKKQEHHLFFAIPYTVLPWNIKTDILPEDIENKFWPVSNWIINKFLTQLVVLSKRSEILFSKWSKIIETVMVENKVREFENNKEKLKPNRYSQILGLVDKIVGIKLPRKEEASTEMVSRQLYNQVLKQANRDYPNLNVGERSNKAYTLWRYVQSEIVSSLSATDKEDALLIRPPESIMGILAHQVESIFTKYNFKSRNKFCHISENDAVFALFDLNDLNPGISDIDKIGIYGEVFSILETTTFQILNQIQEYKRKLQNIQNIKSEFDVEELQTNFIEENVRKLEVILHQKFSQNEEE